MPSRPTSSTAPSPAPHSARPGAAGESALRWSSVAIIITAVLLAYSNTFSAPFVLDDHSSIVTNSSIRDFWSFRWLTPPATAGETVSGRPVLNFTFALNYAAGGLSVRGYHVFNVLVHGLCGVVLFALVRRTLQAVRHRIRTDVATPRAIDALALGVALIWVLHPLHTGSVTYVVQRAESLAGLFYLLTVYGFSEYATSAPNHRPKWAILSVTACLLGMATKETVATAPLVVLLYDRAFLSGSFRAVWRARPQMHAALAATWLLLVALVLTNSGRGGSAGLDSVMDAGTYFLTQCNGVVRYLALTFWPRGQVFDYGVPVVRSFADVVPAFLLLVTLAATALWLLWRNRMIGFLGTTFFLLLAPSSSVVPIATQTIAEHRMYLALIIPVTLACVAVVRWWPRPFSGFALAIVSIVAVTLGATTYARNQDYETGVSLWQDTVTKRPDNPRARNNLGLALEGQGRVDEAITQYRETIALQPNHALANANLGALLLGRGQANEALSYLQSAVSAAPELAEAHYHLGLASEKAASAVQAERAFREAIRLRPDWAAPQVALGNLLAKTSGIESARPMLEEAVRLDSKSAEAHFALGNVLAKQRRLDEAMAEFRTALQLDPSHLQARNNLANCQLLAGRTADAIATYEQILVSRPDDAAVRRNLELAREMQRRH